MMEGVRESLSSLPADDAAAREARTTLVLVANGAMRARRAPWAIAWMWAFESIMALAAAWPITSYVGLTYGRHPQGDAPLWKPGGLALLDLAVAGEQTLRTTSPLVLFVLATSALLGLAPLALLIGQMAFASRQKTVASFAQLMPRAILAFLPMLGVLFATLLVQAIVLAIGSGVSSFTSSQFLPRAGQAQAAQVGGVVLLAFVIVASVFGVLQDLARTAILRFQVNTRGSFVLAASTFRRAPILLYWSWLWRSSAGIVLLVIGSVMAERLGGRSGGAVVGLFLVHQTIVLGRIALRASWLAQALRSMDRAHRVVRRPAGPGELMTTSGRIASS